MTHVRPPEIVDARTAADLPVITTSSVTIDLTDCRIFGAEGYAWLGRLLAISDDIRIVGGPADFARLTRLLVPAELDEHGRLRPTR